MKTVFSPEHNEDTDAELLIYIEMKFTVLVLWCQFGQHSFYYCDLSCLHDIHIVVLDNQI